MSKKTNIIHVSGNRKRAVARATLREGIGVIKVNNLNMNLVTPRISQLRMREPLILAGELAQKVDLSINVFGGGITSQADAVRLAIARALVEYRPKLKDVFLDYDRQLLVADVRRKEESKPNCQGQARSKRQKSYR